MAEDKKDDSLKNDKLKNDKPKNNMTLYIAIGAGVLVLSCCCFSAAGTGIWYFGFRDSSGNSGGAGGKDLETKIIAKWVSDSDPAKKINPKDPKIDFGDLMMGSIEFKADKSVIDGTILTPILLGKWKTVKTKDDVITVELSDGANKKNLEIKVVDADHIKIPHPETKKEYAFKKAK